MKLGSLKRDEVDDESPTRIKSLKRLFSLTGGEEEIPNIEPTCIFIPSEDIIRKVIRAIATFEGDPLHEVLRRFGF